MSTKLLEATYTIKDNKLSMVYNPTPGDFGGYPEPTYKIYDIPYEKLMSALGIKKKIQLQGALKKLPANYLLDNEVIRLKNFCDLHEIFYSYREY